MKILRFISVELPACRDVTQPVSSKLTRKSGKTRCSKCFTLIELLVVVAIISILASILLPGLRKARDRAKDISCKSKIKNIYTASMAYSQDFDGYLMPDGEWQLSDSYRPFPMVLYYAGLDYLPLPLNGRLTNCPENELGNCIIACPSVPSKSAYTDYGINCNFGSGIDLRDGNPNGLRMSQIKHPSRLIYIGDLWRGFGEGYNNGTKIYEIQEAVGANNGILMFRHVGNTANTNYIDGHIKGEVYGSIPTRASCSTPDLLPWFNE